MGEKIEGLQEAPDLSRNCSRVIQLVARRNLLNLPELKNHKNTQND